MAHKKDKRESKIQGLVVPVAWDEEGNPLSVAVATFDEDEYHVHRDAKGDHLLGLLRNEVEVTGFVGIKGGTKTIVVTKYALNKKSDSKMSASEEKHADHTNAEPDQSSRM